MPVSITLGKYDTTKVNASENVGIPALDGVEAMFNVVVQMQSALSHALQVKTGVLVIGPKGVGKSNALDRAIRAHREEEQHFVAKMPGEYRERRILRAHGLSSKTPRELLLSLLQVASPGLRDRALGMRKSDDDLRAELVSAMLNKNYGVVALDEAEYLNDRAIDQLRKVMADSAQRDPRRVVMVNGTEEYRAAGVGVLLVGTKEMLDVVRRSPDAGHRWSEVVQFEMLTPDVVGDCYLQIFPGFRTHVDTIGVDAWREFCANKIALGRCLSLDIVTRHAFAYYNTFIASELADKMVSIERAQIPFHLLIFLNTAGSEELKKFAPSRGTR